MLNKIIQFSLKNRIMVLVCASIIMLWGGIVSSEMDVDVFPDLTAPTVTVITEAHGMATEEVESLISYPIESVMNGAPDVRRIRSKSAHGISIVWVEFEWGTDVYIARQIVSEKLNATADKLPKNIGTPSLGPVSSIMGEVMFLSISSDSVDAMELRTVADWNVRQRLLAVQGVSQVVVMGGEFKQYQILASPKKMKYYGISLLELKDAASNINRNASGGIVNQRGNQYVIRGEGKTKDVKALGNSLLKVIDGIPVLISDVAKVTIGAAPKIGKGSYMGKDAIILTILKQPDANTLKLTTNIDKTLDNIRQQLPPGVHIDSHLFRQADFIQASINNLQKTLLEGAFFVCVILFLFLMNWRTTIISLVTIPISLLTTILVLKFMGLTLNTMSLGGMAIAIGALVDDAIIDVENIYKRLKENASVKEALKKPIITIVFEASKEIRNSILIATLIIVVSFIPLFLLTGMEGRLLEPLGIAFIVALITSLLVAVTVTPVLSSYLLGNHERLLKDSQGSFVERWLAKRYRVVLKLVLRIPKTLVTATALLFAVAMIMFTNLGRSFLPDFNEGSLVISVVGQPGISLEESDKIGRIAELALLEMDEIRLVSRRTGRAEQDEHAQGVNSSEIEAPFQLKNRSRKEFMKILREKLGVIPGVNITIGQPITHRIDHMLSGTRANIAIKVFGPDLNELFNIGKQIKSEIEGAPNLVDVNIEQQIEVPKISIKPKRLMLAKYGLTIQELMDFVDVAMAGERVGQIYDGQKNFDLILRYEANERSNVEQIKNSMLDATGGKKIPLYYVADVEITSSPYTINRENVQRKVVVSANVSGGGLRETVTNIQDIINTNVAVPENYHISYGGQFESEEKATKLLMLTSIGAIIIIFFLLYIEFKNFRLASIVILNLPLALIGGIFTIYFTTGIISIASTIGFISLFGIATRNGILMVSHFQVLLAQGKSLKKVIIQGSMDRLNPILMTALTTALALIPLALAGAQAGNEIQSPMAAVLLGGLLSATVLNIVVIPAIFYLTSKNKSVNITPSKKAN
ncbi:MAG: CzcA family heavy metal efflux pump [Glaciecola sp.]|jgi:CzcA family heavy metal efflux pump